MLTQVEGGLWGKAVFFLETQENTVLLTLGLGL